jgi:hypothetical protein
MRLLILILSVASSFAFAGSAGEATDTPNAITRMVQGLADSKIDELTSKTYTHEGKEYSYHLKTIDFLGTVQRDGHHYTIAAAKFLRSSAKGSEYPPARGHGFLIVFDDTFRVTTHGRMDFGEFHMEDHVLKAGDKVVVDFGSTDPAIRYHGWLMDSAFMPYPFADKISEANWKSGAFRRKP